MTVSQPVLGHGGGSRDSQVRMVGGFGRGRGRGETRGSSVLGVFLEVERLALTGPIYLMGCRCSWEEDGARSGNIDGGGLSMFLPIPRGLRGESGRRVRGKGRLWRGDEDHVCAGCCHRWWKEVETVVEWFIMPMPSRPTALTAHCRRRHGGMLGPGEDG